MFKKKTSSDFPVVQWLRLCAVLQGAQVESWVQEPRSPLPHGTAKELTNKNRTSCFFGSLTQLYLHVTSQCTLYSYNHSMQSSLYSTICLQTFLHTILTVIWSNDWTLYYVDTVKFINPFSHCWAFKLFLLFFPLYKCCKNFYLHLSFLEHELRSQRYENHYPGKHLKQTEPGLPVLTVSSTSTK